MLGHLLSLSAERAIMLSAVPLPRWLGHGPELRRLRRRKAAIQKLHAGFVQRLSERKRDVAEASGLANRAENRRRELMHDRTLAQSVTAAAIRIIDGDRPRPG